MCLDRGDTDLCMALAMPPLVAATCARHATGGSHAASPSPRNSPFCAECQLSRISVNSGRLSRYACCTCKGH